MDSGEEQDSQACILSRFLEPLGEEVERRMIKLQALQTKWKVIGERVGPERGPCGGRWKTQLRSGWELKLAGFRQ